MNDHLFSRRDVPRSQSLTNVPAGVSHSKGDYKKRAETADTNPEILRFRRVSWLRERKGKRGRACGGQGVEVEISRRGFGV